MNMQTAATRINSHPDLTARVRGDRIYVDVYGREAGYVDAADLAQLGHTATGWGRHLRKAALTVWRALKAES